jgi:hypothetical protein
MMKNRNGATTRAMVLAGTALGCTLAAAAPVTAQTTGNVTYTGPGPYTLTQTMPVSGGPRAIDVTVTSGDVTVDTSATTVTTTNSGNATGDLPPIWRTRWVSRSCAARLVRA